MSQAHLGLQEKGYVKLPGVPARNLPLPDPARTLGPWVAPGRRNRLLFEAHSPLSAATVSDLRAAGSMRRSFQDELTEQTFTYGCRGRKNTPTKLKKPLSPGSDLWKSQSKQNESSSKRNHLLLRLR